MKLRWSVAVVATLVLLVVVAVCSAQGQNALDKPGTRAGETATGPDGGVYVWVPAGEFMMGAGDDDKHASRFEKPAHRVRITKGFWLSKCEVTLGQWKTYCQKVGIAVGEARASSDDYPVSYVSWDDAGAYCRAYGLALPTEAQWEYAARGPEGRKYPWGNQWDEDKYSDTGGKGPQDYTFPVGSLPKGNSWCGASDMAGNVWEWCKDWYGEKYYAESATDDPRGPDNGSQRVMRGGVWLLDAYFCRCSIRYYIGPTLRHFLIGCRPSRTP